MIKVVLKKCLRLLWWLGTPIHQPLINECRRFLCACLDRQLKQHTEPLLTELHLRLDSLVREQDRLLAVIEHMQASQPSAVTGWHETESLVVSPSENSKRHAA